MHGRESNSRPVDHKSDALTTTLLPSHLLTLYLYNITAVRCRVLRSARCSTSVVTSRLTVSASASARLTPVIFTRHPLPTVRHSPHACKARILSVWGGCFFRGRRRCRRSVLSPFCDGFLKENLYNFCPRKCAFCAFKMETIHIVLLAIRNDYFDMITIQISNKPKHEWFTRMSNE